jgi:hypothetical protein
MVLSIPQRAGIAIVVNTRNKVNLLTRSISFSLGFRRHRRRRHRTISSFLVFLFLLVYPLQIEFPLNTIEVPVLVIRQKPFCHDIKPESLFQQSSNSKTKLSLYYFIQQSDRQTTRHDISKTNVFRQHNGFFISAKHKSNKSKIYSKNLNQVDNHKHLGVTISSNGRSAEHINIICQKATKQIFVLVMAKYKLHIFYLNYSC